MTKQKERINEREHTREELKKTIKEGDFIYTVLKHVSSSGMTRHITLLKANGDKIEDITHDVAKALDYKMTKNGSALIVGGCGMDMGYHIVGCLAGALLGYISPEEAREEGRYTNCYGLNHAWL